MSEKIEKPKKIEPGKNDTAAFASGGVSGIAESAGLSAGSAVSPFAAMGSLFTTLREQEANKPEVKQAAQIAGIKGDIKENATQIADLTERMQGYSPESNEYKIIKDILVGLNRRGEELNKDLVAVNPYAETSKDKDTGQVRPQLNFEC